MCPHVLQDKLMSAFFTIPGGGKSNKKVPVPGMVAGASVEENEKNCRRTLWAWAVRHRGGGSVCPFVQAHAGVRSLACAVMCAAMHFPCANVAMHVMWHVACGICFGSPSPCTRTTLIGLQFNGEELPAEAAMAAMGGAPKPEELYEVARRIFDLPEAPQR